MKKIRRQSKIIEIVQNNEIDTQTTLLKLLEQEGFKGAQATISRDIRELKLTKATLPNGKQKYTYLVSDEEVYSFEKRHRIFRDAVIDIDFAQNIVVIKTLAGMGNAVGASLDSMKNTEVIGTLAGDDTLLCVLKTEENSIEFIKKIKNIIDNN